MSPWETLVAVLPVLLMSVVAHEWAHARVAFSQGDDTAAEQGRLTLNPIPHIDLWGSILVPAALWLTPGSLIFGWAKPVPVDPRRFRDRRRGDLLVSVAGVTANFALVAVCAAALVGLTHAGRGAGGTVMAGVELLSLAARYGIFINLILGIFNLLPIPPLDGSHLLYHLLPPRVGARYRELGRYSVLLLVAVFIFPEALDVVLAPVWFLDGLTMDLVEAAT